MSYKGLNPDITPRQLPEGGRHPEKLFQKQIADFLLSRGIERVNIPIVTSAHYAFDLLGLPEYSPIQDASHSIRHRCECTTDGTDDQIILDDVRQMHRDRFGLMPEGDRMKREILLTHTTAQLVESLANEGIRDIFTISKVFRGKKERREKTQAEIALVNRSIPEAMALAQNLFSDLLDAPIELKLTSDFYYFLEPSFSFRGDINGQEYALGSAGYIRAEALEILRKLHPSADLHNIIFIGIPYQKLLNAQLGIDPTNFDFDYNSHLT